MQISPFQSQRNWIGFSRGILYLALTVSVFICGYAVAFHHTRALTGVNPATTNHLIANLGGAGKTNGERTSPYDVRTSRRSYFKLNELGRVDVTHTLPVRSETEYYFTRTIHPRETAIVVMDPWIDMPSSHLNEYYGAIFESRIAPLVEMAIQRGHLIIVLTNDPDVVNFNRRIPPMLERLEAANKLAVIFHQDANSQEFASALRGLGVRSLIYTGFASNMCVIGRPMGMVAMRHHGFKLFFVPQASAAVELPSTWEQQEVHETMTEIISQWLAEILDYTDFMSAGQTGQPYDSSNTSDITS